MHKDETLKLGWENFLAKLHTSTNGLTENEVKKRLFEYGPNVLKKNNISTLRVFARQFKSSLIYILIVASLIAFLIKDYSDGIIIIVILAINTTLGFWQEYKSEKTIEKLYKFIKNEVCVRRNGEVIRLDDDSIVPGDVVLIREGDIVPADIRLFEADDLQLNESQITGESLPVFKYVSKDNISEEDLLFTGSVVERGGGVGVVYATGEATLLGGVAVLSSRTEKHTQFEKSLQSFSSLLVKVVLFGLVLIFILKIILNGGSSNISELILFILAMAIAIVPEPLPVIATVSLSSGAMKLAKKHVVVKRLSSVEDLGNVNLLCTDKTGTITENRMTIKSIFSDDQELFQKFACASLAPVKEKKKKIQNSYTDAFVRFVSKDIEKDSKKFTIVKEVPFDPTDRRSRDILKDSNNGKYYLVVIGAPEPILEISKENKNKYLDKMIEEGKSGIHHLAIAYKEVHFEESIDILKEEKNLIFLGYASLEDPLRQSTKETIRHAEKLGLKIKILTGDSKEVAEYVGKETGLLGEGDRVYLGSELEKMSEEDFNEAVLECNVFARVLPDQKYKIIKSLKETYVVGYQGDGINDVPAMKIADVAIAVNSATDVAKENADIVLLNKSLEVIVNGIRYGRLIFVNVNKYIKDSMISNFGNFIVLALLFLISADLPILPIQILLTTVITDIPLIAVSSDTVEDKDVVRPEKHNIKDLMFLSLILGLPTALFELAYFFIIKGESQILLQTSLYVFFTFLGLIVFYSVRNRDHFWKAKRPSFVLNLSFILAFLVSFILIYIPVFQKYFSFTALSASEVIFIVGIMVIYFLVADIVKVWYYRYLLKEI